MNFVYLVSSGEYSDYSVHAAFSTKEVAEVVAKRIGGEVETRAVYDADPPRYTVYVKECYGVREPHEYSFVSEAWNGPHFVGRESRGLGFGKWDGNFRFWGTDKQRVHKAFDDYYAQRRAEAAGIA